MRAVRGMKNNVPPSGPGVKQQAVVHRFIKLLACIFGMVVALGQAPYPQAPATIFPISHKGFAVLLGKVKSATHIEATTGMGTWYTYRVQVLYMMPKPATIGVSATVVGFRTPPRTQNYALYIPIMKPGAYFISSVGYTVAGHKIDWADGGNCMVTPFGVSLPSPVARRDVTSLKKALLIYGRLFAPGHPFSLSHTKVVQLMRSKNYFLWALGIWAFAKIGNRDDMDLLLCDNLQRSYSPGYPWTAPPISPRRAHWIIYCVRHVASPASRPSKKLILLSLKCYLLGISQPNEAGYKP